MYFLFRAQHLQYPPTSTNSTCTSTCTWYNCTNNSNNDMFIYSSRSPTIAVFRTNQAFKKSFVTPLVDDKNSKNSMRWLQKLLPVELLLYENRTRFVRPPTLVSSSIVSAKLRGKAVSSDSTRQSSTRSCSARQGFQGWFYVDSCPILGTQTPLIVSFIPSNNNDERFL
jgi:hypothetical protein